jgi:hypothetical protein
MTGDGFPGAARSDRISIQDMVGVYQELLRFKGELMQLVRSQRATLSVMASAAVAVGVTIIASQAARYLRRLEEWTAIRDRGAPTSEEPIVGSGAHQGVVDEPPASPISAR